MYEYDIDQSVRIKVIGAGHGSVCALNAMIAAPICGVDFYSADIDSRIVKDAEAPSISRQEIDRILKKADMVVIIAAMGNRDEAASASLIVNMAKKNGVRLTVVVALMPDMAEDQEYRAAAEAAAERLREAVDCIIPIPNTDETGECDRSAVVDTVRGMTELLTVGGMIGIDLDDVKSVLSLSGTVKMGIGSASGKNRALEAGIRAMNCSMLEGENPALALGSLFVIYSNRDMTMDDYHTVSRLFEEKLTDEATIFGGIIIDEKMLETVKVIAYFSI